TDAFNVLIENNLVAAGQKSEEQLIAEVMPLALPSSADSLGNCQVTAVEGVAAPITQAFKANNGTGYIYVITGTNGTVVAGVNAFGVVKVLDLEGNDVTAAEADAAAAAQSAAPVLATENLENNTAAAQATVAEGAVLTPVEGLNVTGTAIAAFVADANGETQYVVITAPLGYSNETMKMITVFDAEGNVIFYKTLTELILHGEYYATHELTDESAYRQMFIGVNAGTYSDDMTLVAGATMTANAVASSFNSAFEALDLIKEVVA
ncbi:MAG: hypothetical protein IJE28_04950, partial [Oscillospiraceae bacterium]|nr:hypothetical protein [Oscillospiraceae bacterium]